MSRVLIIGAGGVGNVVVRKCAKIPQVFSDIMLASRTLEKCEQIKNDLSVPIKTAQVNADNVSEVIKLIKDFKPRLVINVALPYQDLPIMDACIETGVDYLDTANYEPKEKLEPLSYKWQWPYHEKFVKKGIMALLGCGFDPGAVNVFCAYAAKKHFDEIHYIDIVDCNAGSHGKAFATNFNPEINIREITQRGKYWENGKWIETDPLSVSMDFDYPTIGSRKSYLLYHEELESLVKYIKGLRRIRFWMTFGEVYLTHLKVFQNIGLTSIKPVDYKGQQVIPLEFLKALLPDPGSLGVNYTGKTCIGCVITGIKNGKLHTRFIYNICDHAEAWKEVRAQAVSYTTGVPAVIAAMLMLDGSWRGEGVFNPEQFNPDPFMEKLNIYGLPWTDTEFRTNL